MKDIIIKLFFALTISVSATSCFDGGDSASGSNSPLLTEFLAMTELSVMVSDTTTKSFDKTTDQVVYNDSRTLYMVSTMDCSTYYTLTIDGELLLDNVLIINFDSKNINNLGSGTATMTVVKIDTSDIRYWLWNNDLELGFIIDLNM